jgi:hypothetical protein
MMMSTGRFIECLRFGDVSQDSWADVTSGIVRALQSGYSLIRCRQSLKLFRASERAFPEAETEMALSAAPEHLRAEAAVYVLRRDGFVKARGGTNGFTCLVLRENGRTAPICYDAEGSQTTLLDAPGQ